MKITAPLLSKWLLWGCWVLIITLCTIFCWERVLYQDSAFALFKVLNLQNTIEHGRFIVPVVLWPGYLCSALSLPISWAVLGISLSNALWGLILTLYFYKKSGYELWTWAPALILLCTGPDFFFLGFAEMIPALFLTVLFAFELSRNHAFSWGIMALAFFAHPGVLPSLFVILAINLIQNHRSKSFKISVFALIIIIASKLFIFKNSEYEQGIINQIKISDLQHFGNSWGFDYFLSSFKTWLMPVAFFAMAILFIGKFQWRVVAVFLVILFAMLFIVFVYRSGDSNLMMQKSYAPMLLMSFCGLASMHQSINSSKWLVAMVSILCLVGGIYRIQEGEFYRNRLKKLDKVIAECGPGKFFVLPTVFNPEDYRVNWAIPYESLIRSSYRNGAKNTTTFAFTDSSTLFSNSNLNNLESGLGQFKGADFAYPVSHQKLRQRYFQMDSFSRYQRLKRP